MLSSAPAALIPTNDISPRAAPGLPRGTAPRNTLLLVLTLGILALAVLPALTSGFPPASPGSPSAGPAGGGIPAYAPLLHRASAAASLSLGPLAATGSDSPTMGIVGTIITFSGTGWGSGGVAVTWNPPTGGTTAACAGTTSGGDWSCTYTLPAGPAGTYPFTANGAGAGPVTIDFTIVPALTASPSSGIVGTSVAFSGTGFAASSTVTVSWPRGVACTATSDSTGTSTPGSFTCPGYQIPPAAHFGFTFTANDSATPTPNTASTIFTPLAHLAVTPAFGIVGSKPVFTGTGYDAGFTAYVNWSGGAGCKSLIDARGGFNCTYTIPAAAAFDYPFFGNDSATPPQMAQTSFEVIPSLVVSGVSGTVGSSATVTGAGYGSTLGVTTTWKGVGEATQWFCQGTASVVGAFSCTGTFANGVYGSGTLTATDTASNTAATSFEVLPSLTATPSSGPVGTTVVLTGSGWPGTDPGVATWVPTGSNVCSFRSDANGNFTCTGFSVPASPSGAAKITADDHNSIAASTYFTVTSSLATTLADTLPATDVGVSDTFTATATGGLAPYTYTWNFGDGTVVTTSTPSASHTFGTRSPSGGYMVGVTVTDSYGSTASASLALPVYSDPVVSAPVATAPSADVGQSVSFSTSASGGTGPYTTYAWTGLPPGACTGTTTATVACLFGAGMSGTLTLSVTVTDSVGFTSGSSAALSYVVHTDPVPALPSASQPAGDVGQSLSLWTTTSGGSGGDSYSWFGLPTLGCARPTTAATSCSLLTAGTYFIWANVTDSNGVTGMSAVLTFAVSPALTIGSPTASVASLDVGQTTALTVATSGGAAPIALAWVGLPAGCSSANADSVSCTPSASGSYAVTVDASDANGETATSAPITLVVHADLGQLSLTAGRSQLDVGQSTAFTALDASGDGGLSFSWVGLPTGCTSSGASTVLCFPSEAGTYEVNAWANDSQGGSVEAAAPLTITVSPELSVSAPTVSAVSVESGYSVSFSASTSGGLGPISYSWSGLPSGCTGGTGATVSCAPTVVGTYTISVVASDQNGEQASSGPTAFGVTAVPPATTFDSGANGLEWAILGLVVLVLVLALIAVVLAAMNRRGGDGAEGAMEASSEAPAKGPTAPSPTASSSSEPSRPAPKDWDEDQHHPKEGTPAASREAPSSEGDAEPPVEVDSS